MFLLRGSVSDVIKKHFATYKHTAATFFPQYWLLLLNPSFLRKIMSSHKKGLS